LGYPSPAETLREREAPSGLRSSTQPTLFKVFGQNLRSIGSRFANITKLNVNLK
jgi:hypothetical protein